MYGDKVCSPDPESAPMTTYYSHALGIQSYQNMLFLHVYIRLYPSWKTSLCIHACYWYQYKTRAGLERGRNREALSRDLLLLFQEFTQNSWHYARSWQFHKRK